jgi:hypothetical protein
MEKAAAAVKTVEVVEVVVIDGKAVAAVKTAEVAQVVVTDGKVTPVVEEGTLV